MPVDKRILKTKRNLKQTLHKLLMTKSLEKINVSEVCEAAETTRMTFYTYYDDKYALAKELMYDYYIESDMIYHELQKANNPDGDAMVGYRNLFECIVIMFDRNLDFFQYMTIDRNPYLYSAFFNQTLAGIADYIERHDTVIKSRFPAEQTAALLCSGLSSVIFTTYKTPYTSASLVKNVRQMYLALLDSELFIKAQ